MTSHIGSTSSFVFSATWAASFVPLDRKKLIDLLADYKLLCHGLWPTKHAANCIAYEEPRDPEIERKMKRYICHLVKGEKFDAPWIRQWDCHGCWSGLSSEEYWNLIVDVCERFLNPTSKECILNKLRDRGLVPGMDVTTDFLSTELSAAFGYDIDVTVGIDKAKGEYYFGEIRIR